MESKGFFGGLFDLSFSEFVTTRIIKVIYVLAIVLAALVCLGMLVTGITNGFGSFILALIMAPLFFIIYVIMARVWLEVIIVIFRIAENIQYIAEREATAHETYQNPAEPV